MPAAQTTNEDTALVFSTGNSNLISVSDLDLLSGDLKVTVAVDIPPRHGTYTGDGRRPEGDVANDVRLIDVEAVA